MTKATSKMRNYILVLRHAESKKNTTGTLSGDAANDHLTAVGKAQAKKVSDLLSQARFDLGTIIYCANSKRAKETADILFHSDKFERFIVDEFGSASAGSLSGKSDNQIIGSDPNFFAQMQLFRAGLMSAYDVEWPNDAENWRTFECSVMAAFDRYCVSPAGAKVVIAHRSAILAILINMARRYHGYPEGFFGYLRLNAMDGFAIDLGENSPKISILNDSRKSGFQLGKEAFIDFFDENS